jgi:hypothetical protein
MAALTGATIVWLVEAGPPLSEDSRFFDDLDDWEVD